MAEEEELVARIERTVTGARELGDQSEVSAGDKSVADELKEEQFTEAETYWVTLRQVRDALKRLDDGTFGRCLVDGEPIEEKRLEAMPWTPYCLKHAQLLEKAERTKTPTL
jgi:DnaK suppressor protein